jgi:hypothetical protein
MERNDMKRFDNLFTLGLTFLLSPLGALAQVAPADQGTINHRDSNAVARREDARPVRLTVPPKGHAPITMATLPNAVCSLHSKGDTTKSLKLFADEEGIVRFHAGGSGEPIWPHRSCWIAPPMPLPKPSR